MKAPITSMQHLNGNLLCSVDIETTGLRAGWHDLIQIAIVPLNGDLAPMLEPFYITILPENPKRISKRAMQVNKIKLSDVTLDKWDGQGLLEDWYDKTVKGNDFKKITMLGQNLNFDIPFIKEWMDYDMDKPEVSNADAFFDTRNIRDTKRVAEYLNDLAYFKGEPFPFAKTNLKYLCNIFGIDSEGAHDALVDAINTAQVYRRLMSLQIRILDFGAVDER